MIDADKFDLYMAYSRHWPDRHRDSWALLWTALVFAAKY
jgi:hypothetical protein